MTSEEIKQILQTEAGKAVLAEITVGLEGNKNQILSEKKTLAANLESLSMQLQDLQKANETLVSENRSIVVNTAIDSLMTEMKILPELRRAVKARIEAEPLTISEEQEGMKVVLVGSGDEAQPLDAWAAAWAETDEGKAFRASPVNTGAGSRGSDETPSNASRTPLREKSDAELLSLFDKRRK